MANVHEVVQSVFSRAADFDPGKPTPSFYGGAFRADITATGVREVTVKTDDARLVSSLRKLFGNAHEVREVPPTHGRYRHWIVISAKPDR